MTTELVHSDQGLNITLTLLNDRFPIMIYDTEPPVRDRVAWARVFPVSREGAAEESYNLEITTYHGRYVLFEEVTEATLRVTDQDVHGVPLKYEVTLNTPEGTHTLRFFA